MREYRFYTYILECTDKSFYIGITRNLDYRFWQHQIGENPKCYTFNKRPVKLAYYEEYQYVYDAINREKQLKGWSHTKKQALIDMNDELLSKLSKNNQKCDTSAGSV